MKKIDIITLNNVVNYGSVLQTYALQEKIKELGYDAEVIDYFPERLTMHGMLKRIKNKGPKFKNPIICFLARLIMFPSYVVRFKMFRKFNKKYINLTNRKYKCDSDFIKYPLFCDAFCTGSDQVWNSGWNEGITKPFYLDFTDKYKFAYAASFGKKSIEPEEEKLIKPMLSKYYKISCREYSGVEILNKMGLDAVEVLDPTLLLNSTEWSKLASKKYEGKKYILMYNLNRNMKLWNIAKEISKRNNLQLIYISYNFAEFIRYGKIACNKKVEDFLSLIKNASLVLTDSFHATAFSLNFNKNFYIVYPEKFSGRLQNVLEKTGLLNRVIETADSADMNKNIDYAEINLIFENERIKSMEYLKTCLQEIK